MKMNLILKKELKFSDPEFLVTNVQDILDEYKVTSYFPYLFSISPTMVLPNTSTSQ